MSQNCLSVISKRSFCSFARLRELDLSGNALSSLSFIEPLKKLQCLDIKGNRLRAVDDLPTMPEMMKLNLADNLLENVEKTGKLFPNLVEIDVSGNRLSDAEQFKFVASLKLLISIDARNNPFWTEQHRLRVLEWNDAILEIDGEETSRSREEAEEDESELKLEFDEARKLVSRKLANDLKLKEVSRRLDAEYSEFEQQLNRKLLEAEFELRSCESFVERVYNVKPSQRALSAKSLQPEHVPVATASFRSESKAKENVNSNSQPADKSRNFRVKKLASVVSYPRHPSVKGLRAQSEQLKALFGIIEK